MPRTTSSTAHRDAAQSVRLPASVITRLCDEARRTPQFEVCGLVARSHADYRVYPVRNVAGSPGDRFHLDPRQQIDAMRQMRNRGETLFAIYHSHPDADAQPSRLDLEQAAYPDALYLIISLVNRRQPEVRGYRIRNAKATEVTLST